MVQSRLRCLAQPINQRFGHSAKGREDGRSRQFTRSDIVLVPQNQRARRERDYRTGAGIGGRLIRRLETSAKDRDPTAPCLNDLHIDSMSLRHAS